MRRYGIPLAAFLLGGSIPLILVWLYFLATGALGALHETLFVFAPRYTALQLSAGQLPALVGSTVRIWLFDLSPYNTIGLVALLLLPPLHGRERAATAHLLGVIAFTLLGVTLQRAGGVPTHTGPGKLYGLGVSWRRLPAGERLFHHSGNTGDFAADVYWIPERGFAVAVLAGSHRHLRATLHSALEHLAGIDTKPPEPRAPDVARYVGSYETTVGDLPVLVTREAAGHYA